MARSRNGRPKPDRAARYLARLMREVREHEAAARAKRVELAEASARLRRARAAVGGVCEVTESEDARLG